MTEEELLSGCQRGDREAQRELFTRTSDRIYRLLQRLTHNEADAADLLQDVYVRAFERLDRFHGTSSLATWLYRIALNEAKQFFRNRTRRDEILRAEVPPPPQLMNGQEQAMADRLDVHAAISRLPDEERTLIILRYFEDMDYARMAEILEKPAGTIASGLNRARRMLEQLLDVYAGSETGGEENEPLPHPTDRA